jgi:hypothetical protein
MLKPVACKQCQVKWTVARWILGLGVSLGVLGLRLGVSVWHKIGWNPISPEEPSPRRCSSHRTRLAPRLEWRQYSSNMMRYFALLLLLTCLSVGCARNRYMVILRNGQSIAASTRPKVDPATSVYHFKDRTGRPVAISAYDISEIEVR